MSVKRAKAGHAEVTASIKDKISGGLKRIKAKMQSFASGSARIGGGLLAAGAAGLAPIVMGVKKFMSVGDQINKISARTGTSAESLSTLGFAATESGANIGTLEKGIVGMQKTIRNAERGLSTAKDALDTVGVSMEDLEGKTPVEQIKILADGLLGLDEGKRAAVAMDLFGKSGQKLLPMLNAGSEGIEKMQQSARDFGLEISTEDANSAAELTDRFYELTEILKATAFQVGAALAPALIKAATWLSHSATTVLEFIRNNRQMIVIITSVLLGVVAAGTAFLALGGFIGVASFAVGGLISAISLLGSLFGLILSPIGLIGIALVAGVAAWLYYTDSGAATLSYLSDKLGQLLSWGKAVFGGVYDAIQAGDWQLAGTIMWTALKIAWQTGISWLQGLWIDFKFGMFSVFDVMVTGFRSKWNSVTSFIAKGIIWLIDKANAASEALTGAKVIDVDTAAMSKMIDEDNDRFQKKIFNAQVKREMGRLKEIAAAKKKLSTKGLQDDLNAMIATAAEKRAIVEAEAALDKPTGPSKPQLDKFEMPKQSGLALSGAGGGNTAMGSFSINALAAFATKRSVEDRNAKANEQTAENTQTIADQGEDNEGLTVS